MGTTFIVHGEPNRSRAGDAALTADRVVTWLGGNRSLARLAIRGLAVGGLVATECRARRVRRITLRARRGRQLRRNSSRDRSGLSPAQPCWSIRRNGV
jgi:hypothetical protein